MRPDELPLPVIAEQVKRLVRAFPQSKVPEVGGFAEELRRATRSWTERELELAFDGVIRTERYWPRIAAILAAKPISHASPIDPATGGTGCRVCGKEPFLAGYETATGEVIGRYRCACPTGGGGWATEKARAWRAAA